MQVTLKKAHELSRLALTAAGKIEIFTSVQFNMLVEVEPEIVLENARSKLNSAYTQKLALVDAANGIRRLIGETNARVGITDMMATDVLISSQMKQIETMIKLLEPVIGRAGRVYDNDPDLIKARLSDIKRQVLARESQAQVGYLPDIETTFTVSLGTEEQVEQLKVSLASLATDKVDNKDKMTFLNFSTQITLPETIVETLKKNLLVK